MSKESPDKRRLTSERIDEIREAYRDPGGTAVDMTNGEMVALCDMASAPSHEQPNTQKPGVLATSKEDTLESGLTGRRDGHSAPSTTPPKDHFPYAENMVNAPRTLDKYKSTQPNSAPQRPVAWIATNGSGKVLHLSAADGWSVEVVQEQPNPAPQELPAVNSARPDGEPGTELPPKGGQSEPCSSQIRDSAKQPAAAGPTPRTDAIYEDHGGRRFKREPAYYHLIEHARNIERNLAAERERADMNYEHCKLAERWRDDWHRVADDRSAEIVRLSGELAAAEQDAVRWRRYQMERAGLPVSAIGEHAAEVADPTDSHFDDMRVGYVKFSGRVLPSGTLLYAVPAISREKIIRECWDAIDAQIKRGELPGNGCDKSAERNGIVLASNILAGMMGWPKAQYAEDIRRPDGGGEANG